MRGSPAAVAAGLLLLLAATTAAGAEWRRFEVLADGRPLAAAAPLGQAAGDFLTIVIEGDGPAHDRRGRPSADPTPRRPEGLAIAQAWPDDPVAWLARPCQFTRKKDPACRPDAWSRDRFGAPALAALDAGVEALKQRFGARQVQLVGWSGGGVMAAALAARRADAAGLATFAAPLDVDAWTKAAGTSSLPLAPEVAGLAHGALDLAQWHGFGRRDVVVHAQAGASWARRLAPQGTVIETDDAHACCWATHAAEAADALRSGRAPPPP